MKIVREVTIEDVIYAKDISIRAAKKCVLHDKKLRRKFESHKICIGHSNNNALDRPKAFSDDLENFVNASLNYRTCDPQRRIVKNDYGRLCINSDVVVEIEIED